MPQARTLAEVYRRFGEGAASPLDGRVAVALSESGEALRAIESAPARTRHPALILAALHDLALSDRAPALATAYSAADGDAVTAAAIDTLLHMADAVLTVAGRRPVGTLDTDRCAVLYPAVAEVARRVGADAVGLIDVGGTAGLNASVDRVGITYSTGHSLGNLSSPLQLSSRVVGDLPIPAGAIPEVDTRIAVGSAPVDVTDAESVRWLHACLPPDQPDRHARLDAEIAVAASSPPLLMRGDPVALLPEALARVPAGALPVVTTTWTLSGIPPDSRRRFVHQLEAAATHRPVAWVSVEGVGVAPTIATLGDRPASGHSLIGLARFDGSALPTETVGRCWSRGRVLSWLVDS